jgi:hypothetical protein
MVYVVKYKSEEDSWVNAYVFGNYTASDFTARPTLQIDERIFIQYRVINTGHLKIKFK